MGARILHGLNGSDINYCLGYRPDKVLSTSDRKVGENIISLNLYLNRFIYSSIVQKQLVGDNQGTDSNTCSERRFYIYSLWQNSFSTNKSK